ncbi:MAG: NADH-quinone oxidoreductase subunit N [Thermoplasmata archaeon]|nr:NADH-quinone oxidoreductase subunit N [Thermoplasmata archaeon]
MNGITTALEFLPEILVLAGALLVLLLDVVGVRRLEAFGGVIVAAFGAALVAILADLSVAPFAGWSTLPAGSLDVGPVGGSLYAFTSFGLVFQGIFLSAALLVAVASLSRTSNEKGASVFYALLGIAALGMLLVAVSADLIFLLLSLEVTAISSYLLVGYTRRESRGLEAAMKFYIIGALSAALSFYGASLLYGAYGTTSLAVIGHSYPSGGLGPLAIVGYAFLFAGIGFEVTIVPFHAWAVDVYDGAPTDVSAFLAGGTKKVGLFAFFAVFLVPLLLIGGGAATASGSFRDSLQILIAVFAILTMTIGNVLALMQDNMKRMLAYSSISQAGYMLLGVAVATSAALTGATLQIFAHVLLKGGAFLVVAAAAGLGVGPMIADWKGFGHRRPVLGASFALMLLGLAGIPLTIGFVSKFILFAATVQAEGLFLWLAIAGLLNSALSVFYYARVLRTMYAESPEGALTPTEEVRGLAFDGLGLGRAVAIGAAVVAIVGFGVDPQPLVQVMQAAVQHFVTLGI